MKLKLAIIAALLLCLTSCDSPESIAEKSLEEIGNGKYRFDIDKIFMGINDDIFSMALVNNAEAEDFLKGKKAPNGYKNLFFQTSYVFGEWRLVDKTEFPFDLHFVGFRPPSEETEMAGWWNDHKNLIIQLYDSIGGKYNGKELVYFSDDAIVEKRKAVPITRLRYKVDNSRIAIIDVIKSDKGCRVASFMWEK